MTEYNRQVGERIRKLRVESGHTQAQVAEAVGIETRSVSRKESGSNAWSLWEIMRVADFYNRSLDYLIRGKETAPVCSGGNELASDESRLVACYRSCSEDDKKELLLIAIDFALATPK